MTNNFPQPQLIQQCLTISLDTAVEVAVRVMSQRNTSYVLVLEQQKLVGIFTQRDLVKAIASGVNLKTTTLSDVMTQPVITVEQSALGSLLETLDLLQHHSISHLPILDAQEQIIGVITPESILATLQQAIRQSEQLIERWELAIAGSNDGIWDHNLETDDLFFSPRCMEILGYDVTEVATAQEWQQRIHPDDAPRIHHSIQQCHSGETSKYFVEHRMQCRDGSYKWVLVRGKTLLNQQEKPIRIAGSITDISEYKQQQEALQKSEERLQLALEASGDGMWDWNVVTDEVYYSPRYWEMLGYTKDEFPQDLSHWEKLIHPEDRIWVQQLLKAHLQDNTIGYSFDYRMLTKSGEWRWIADYGKVVMRDENGQALRMAGTHQDIHERKLSEAALRQSESTLRSFFNSGSMLMGIVELCNNDILHLSDNQAAAKFFGTTPQAMQNRFASEMGVPRIIIQQWINYYQQAYAAQAPVRFEYTHNTATEQRWLAASVCPVGVSSSGNFRFSYIVEDVTDRKLAELALQQAKEAAEVANQAKSIFLANMSHELRTPLNVILGFAQVMSRDSSLTPELRESLNIIHRSGDHLLELINDILDLSKIEAGRLCLDESGFDLPGLLKSLHNMFSQRAEAKALQLHLDLAENLPQFIITDPNKLRQVLINLLNNAIKFTKRGSVTLRVRGAVPQDHQNIPAETHPFYTLHFAVEDTGIGISPNDLQTIFDAFVQAQAGKTSLEGTGLGLTITKKFIQLMGGTITATSIFGVGSTFWVKLPVRLARTNDIPPSVVQRQVIGLAPDQPPYRILVVDDQAENRLLLFKLLTIVELEVKEADTGEAAIQLWQEWHPHLIFMDIRMPGMDGDEATQQIRSHPDGQTVIIIALTAQASRGDRTLALSAGCNDFIAKPFQEQELFSQMETYLGLRYIFADSESSTTTPTQEELTNNSLSVMPPAWIQQLYQAALHCDDDAVIHLVRQIPPQHTSLITALSRLAHDYQFQIIVKYCQEFGE